MATKRKTAKSGTKKQATRRSDAVTSQLKKVLRKEFDGIKVTSSDLKPASHDFEYKIDDFRSLRIGISIKPFRTMTPVLHMTVEPGKIKIKP